MLPSVILGSALVPEILWGSFFFFWGWAQPPQAEQPDHH